MGLRQEIIALEFRIQFMRDEIETLILELEAKRAQYSGETDMSDETKAMEMNPVQVGDIVLYVMDKGMFKGEYRPAIVVKVWDSYFGTCNLMLFPDGLNDRFEGGINDGVEQNVIWKTSIGYGNGSTPNTWCFKQYVPREVEAH